MKFMVISKMKDIFYTLPPSVGRQLMEATAAYMAEGKKKGEFLEFYFMAGWNRSMVISEAKSAEEIVKNISGLPIGGFMDFEVYPLADPFESMKTFIESMKAAEKMFPGLPK